MTAALATALVVLVAACTSESAAPPAATTPSTVSPLAAKASEQLETVPTLFFPPGFVPADTRGVQLPELVSLQYDQPPIPVFGGHARITGTVVGPDGPVEGATVRLERFVDGRGGFADVRTIAGGRWEAADVYGGHYRVRAWLRPNLATTEPQVGFVADLQDTTVELAIAVEKHEAKRLQAALDVGDPHVGQPVTLLVLHDQEDVNENGLVVGKPWVDTDIDLTVSDGIEVLGEPRARTGLDGYARFVIRCTQPGAHDVSVSGDNMATTVTLPECLSPDEVTESTTTTTAPPEESTTTTTSAVFTVGRSFTTPYLAEIPAGTYVAPSDSAACSTDYELYVFTGWEKVHVNGPTIVVPYPARNLTPALGTRPCTFRRTK